MGKNQTIMEMIAQNIDPEIREFEQWFSSPDRGRSPLTGFEREILRAFLYWKLTQRRSEGEGSAALHGETADRGGVQPRVGQIPTAVPHPDDEDNSEEGS